ncbi:MAG: hypothetical protein ABEI74_00300 [Candidatus Pacearchaeota archaeon]
MKGLQDWKEFYGKERKSMQDEVARASIRSWENRSNGENSQKIRNARKEKELFLLATLSLKIIWNFI